MHNRIKASFENLLKDAEGAGHQFFYAADHMLQLAKVEYTTADTIALAGAMAKDYQATMVLLGLQQLADAIQEQGEAYGQNLERIGQQIAEAIEDLSR